MLHAVATTPDQAPAPDGLITGGPGEHLWTSVTAEYSLRPDERRVLEDAARLADEIAARDKLIAELAASIGGTLTVAGSQGYNRRPNPLLGVVRAERAEQRKDRLALEGMLARLKLADVDPPAPSAGTGQTLSGGTAGAAALA
ncbi:hypothetical protein ACJEIK_26340 [Mycobacterium sp. SMC-16]|uniref:hypothetical protein n=1 Tax=Mycobacterium sp. SMC-16 TaxID=3385967 RepID=UPI00390C5690